MDEMREDTFLSSDVSLETNLASKKNLPRLRWRIFASLFSKCTKIYHCLPCFIFDPDSVVVCYWMAIVSMTVLYNAWMIALRIAFPEIRDQSSSFYLRFMDTFCDIVYVVDILVQLRTAYLHDGIPVFDTAKIRHHYACQSYFWPDLISVVPVENILCFIPESIGVPKYVWTLGSVRLTRLFKFHVLSRFYDVAESRTSNPHFIRVFRIFLFLAVIIHWIACLYYLLSEYEGLGTNDWVYTNDPKQQRFRRKYVVCMYWSAMTLTTIGNNNAPETDLEYIFTGVVFLTGVFVFATVLGNVGDVISSVNANRQEFQARMDHIKMYLTHKKVPASLQLKIKKWAEYSWSRTKATDESRLLNMLPERLRAEVAVHVHLDSLKKVKIFEQCETGFLCELVLKLRSQVFSPGDYICKAGETGREMYIINHGKVEVIVPNPAAGKEVVLAELCEGNYFGEISLLRLDGVQNRRTADVRSIGYSELLCLSRRDLMGALVEYPEAKSVLESQAKKRMKTSLQAQRAFSVDALLRNSQENNSSVDSNSSNREDTRGRDVTEIKAMIEDLKNVNRVPGKTIWQLIGRCELLQEKIKEKEKEVESSKLQIAELERLLWSNRQAKLRKFSSISDRQIMKVQKQFSQEEGRYGLQENNCNEHNFNLASEHIMMDNTNGKLNYEEELMNYENTKLDENNQYNDSSFRLKGNKFLAAFSLKTSKVDFIRSDDTVKTIPESNLQCPETPTTQVTTGNYVQSNMPPDDSSAIQTVERPTLSKNIVDSLKALHNSSKTVVPQDSLESEKFYIHPVFSESQRFENTSEFKKDIASFEESAYFNRNNPKSRDNAHLSLANVANKVLFKTDIHNYFTDIPTRSRIVQTIHEEDSQEASNEEKEQTVAQKISDYLRKTDMFSDIKHDSDTDSLYVPLLEASDCVSDVNDNNFANTSGSPNTNKGEKMQVSRKLANWKYLKRSCSVESQFSNDSLSVSEDSGASSGEEK